MSKDIYPGSISKIEELEELKQAVDFFQKHEYHLPSITQSPDGLRFATKYWLDPRVKTDKYIFSEVHAIQNKIDSVIHNLLQQHRGEDVPPTQPPASIPAPDEIKWEQFDPTPYIGCDVPPTEPPASIPAPDESESTED
jgi:hypothetical protein